MLQGERRPAGAGVHAHAGLVHPHPVGEGRVEHLDEDVTHVVTRPLLEHLDEELAVLLGADRAVRDAVTGLPVQRSLAGAAAPAGLGEGSISAVTLDDGDQLHVLSAQVVPRKV